MVKYDEILSYECNPELYYQSYEDLVNNAADLREDYINNEEHGRMVLRNHLLMDNYATKCGMSGCRIDEVLKLEKLECFVLNESAILVENTAIIGLLDLIICRKREYELVNLFSQILNTEKTHEILALKEKASALNNVLYGKAEEKVLWSALHEVLSKADFRESQTFNELNKRMRKILGAEWMAKVDLSKPLPRLSSEVVDYLRQFIDHNFGDIRGAIFDRWQEESDELMRKTGEKYQAGPEEIVEYFELALEFFNKKWPSDIKVLLDENQSALSWNGEKRAVMVGAKRAPIKSAKVMFSKIVHELLVHGQRAVRGEKIHPILGIGLFTRESYLDFEEGLATILETVSQGKDLTWDMSTLGLYINIALADKGASFDDIYEINWRLRALELMDNGKYSEENVLVQKRNAYNQTVRVFRGTPMALEFNGDRLVLFYGKDLAYLSGKLKAIKYLNNAVLSGKLDLNEMLSGKFDPTNEKHVRTYNCMRDECKFLKV